MNCILSASLRQTIPGAVIYPEQLYGFINEKTDLQLDPRPVYHIYGRQAVTKEDSFCPHCSCSMHRHGCRQRILAHESKGQAHCLLHVTLVRFRCPHCGTTHLQKLPYECHNHRITLPLYQQIIHCLHKHTMTLKEIASFCGVDPHTVKAIDKERLLKLYTIDGVKLIQPEKPVKYLGIDEFKLHNGHQYATHIIDLETGHILWIAFGKRKQIVSDFIAHVSEDWMRNVEAVSCDMNASFTAAFLEECPWLAIVYDPFHIRKNFNDKVIAMVRKDEQRRLLEQGEAEKARALKRCRYILMTSHRSLDNKEQMASQGKILRNGSVLFNSEPKRAKAGCRQRYKQLLKENELFFTLDLVKTQLELAFSAKEEDEMARSLNSIIEMCLGSRNIHLEWFAKLIQKHWEGIITHAALQLSNGKIEGINNRIKTIRRMGYGYPDDEYFFLKLMDMSRNRPSQILH